MRKAARFVVGLVTSVLLAAPVLAQDYPNKPIHFIVPYSAGSPPDVVTRHMATAMGTILGQPSIVENRPGADTIIGFEYVAKSAPADGYTVVIAPMANQAILPLVSRELRFDPIKDLPPFIQFAEGRLVFGTPASNPWKTFGELVAAVKSNSNKYNYGSPSAQLRFPMLLLMENLGLDLTYVPYATVAPYYIALSVNEVQMGWLSEGSAASLKDKFRVLAVTGDRQSSVFPDAPTFARLGFPQMPSNIFAFSVRVGTPTAIVGKLNAAAVQALHSPDVKAKLAAAQFEMSTDTSQQGAINRLNSVSAVFADVARKVGIKPR